MIERRKVPRQRVLLGSWAEFSHWHIMLDCVVRDMSEDGARLCFERPSLIPNTFDLIIGHQREGRTIRTVWRKGAEVGVSFHPASDTMAPAPGQDHAAQVDEDVSEGAAQEARDRAVLAQRIASFVTHRRRPERVSC